MSVQRYPTKIRQQAKIISSGRNTLPSKRDNNVILIRHKPATKIQQFANSNQYQKIINQKLAEKRAQQYLQRDDRNTIRYESQIQKLSKICQQFFHQNQRLKQKMRQKNNKEIQVWIKRVSELEYQLSKSNQIISIRNKTIQDLTYKNQMSQNINVNKSEPIGHRLLSKNHNDGPKMDQLLVQLQNRESQILKFMHKQSQYIQIYVQKQQLQKQIRNLQTIVQNQRKQLDEFKRSYNLSMSSSLNAGGMMNVSRSTYFPIKLDQQESRLEILKQPEDEQKQKQMQKITQYNNKLLQHLKMSSKQIDRLNKLLKNKVQEIDNKNKQIQAKSKELQDRLRQVQQKNKQIQIMNGQVQKVKQSVSQLQWRAQQRIRKQIQHLKNELEKAQRIEKCKNCQQVQQNSEILISKIAQLQQIIQQRANRIIQIQKNNSQLAQQKKSLELRLNQQVHICWQLKQLIIKMQQLNKQSQINFMTQLNNQKAMSLNIKQKQKPIYLIQQEQSHQNQLQSYPQQPTFSQPYKQSQKLLNYSSKQSNLSFNIQLKQKKDQYTQIQDFISKQIQIKNQEQKQEIKKKYEERIQSLKDQNQQLSKFVMRQTAQMVQIKDQVRRLEDEKGDLTKQLQKQDSQKVILSKRIMNIEQKLQDVKRQYQLLLNEVQSSCNQTQSIQKNIQQILKQKMNIIGISKLSVTPIKQTIIHSNSTSQSMTNIRKNVMRSDEYLMDHSKTLSNNSQPWGKKGPQ